MLAIGKQQKVKATGKRATIPPNDVSRLSYFLNCGTVGCGIDIIVDDLVDYKNVHRLSSSKQDAIFELAYDDFDDDTLLGKTIFPVPDGHSLLNGYNNEFYEIEEVSSLLAVDSSALIAGQQTEVTKIMVCNKRWLEDYYYNPINRNSSRIRRIMKASQEKKAAAELSNLLALLCKT